MQDIQNIQQLPEEKGKVVDVGALAQQAQV